MDNLCRFLSKVTAWFNLWLTYIAAFIMVGIMLTVIADVSLRNIFGRPLTGITEISGYVLLYLTFLPVAWILSTGGHVSIDFLVKCLGESKKTIYSMVTDTLMIVYSLVSMWITWRNAWMAFKDRAFFWGELGVVPQFPVLIVIPVGFALLTLQLITHLCKDITDFIEVKKQRRPRIKNSEEKK